MEDKVQSGCSANVRMGIGVRLHFEDGMRFYGPATRDSAVEIRPLRSLISLVSDGTALNTDTEQTRIDRRRLERITDESRIQPIGVSPQSPVYNDLSCC